MMNCQNGVFRRVRGLIVKRLKEEVIERCVSVRMNAV